MRVLFISIICIALGATIGFASARSQRAADPGFGPNSHLLSEVERPPRSAKIEIEGGEIYDFGAMEFNTEKKYDFVIRNLGELPLTLKAGPPTCRCTISKLQDEVVPPGGQTVATLSWKPKVDDDNFSQGINITTNDPVRPEVRLRVTGLIVRSLRPDADIVLMPSVTASEGGAGKLRVFSYLDDVQITGLDFSKPETASFFTAEMRPVPPEDVAERKAKSGVEITVTAARGLPVGPLDQELRVTTNMPDSAPILLALKGNVVSDISLLGPKVIAEANLINLETMPQGQGAKVTVQITIKGARRNDVQLKIKSIDPAGAIKAHLEPAQGSNATLVRFPLVVEIPPETPNMNHLGTEVARTGKIVLETTHPDVPEFTIKVRFAVD